MKNSDKVDTNIQIGLAGDTMLGRLLNDAITDYGFAYPWGNILPILHSTNLNLVNLETTFTKHEKAVPKIFNFRSNPENVETLKKGRIDVVSLANNHIGDFGQTGLLDTIKILNDAGIHHVGAGINEVEARKPVIITKKDIHIGILGATDNEPGWKAGTNKPGTNYFSEDNHQQLLNDIASLKNQVDVVIVSLHWGPNMKERPSQAFTKLAHTIIDAGADILHGHSAHILQGIEVYKNKLIFYDTGDFVDDYAVDAQLRNDWSCFFNITLNKNKILSIQLVPLLISHFQVNKAPEKTAKEIISRMQLLSKEFNTYIDNNGKITL